MLGYGQTTAIGKVDFDDEAGIFHGEVINTRDVITFQGTTVDEIRQAFHDSVEDYLAFCKQLGHEPEKPFTGKFMLRLPPISTEGPILLPGRPGKV